jgi:hypothetical protein
MVLPHWVSVCGLAEVLTIMTAGLQAPQPPGARGDHASPSQAQQGRRVVAATVRSTSVIKATSSSRD